jgi:hypothetical protein
MKGKELPKPKKSLKSFILEEDAKVMDKTATKLAITASFLAINFLAHADDANAKGHKNHSNHQNNVNAPNNYDTGIHAGNNPTTEPANEEVLPAKSIETWHANHYNHTDGGSYGVFDFGSWYDSGPSGQTLDEGDYRMSEEVLRKLEQEEN